MYDENEFSSYKLNRFDKNVLNLMSFIVKREVFASINYKADARVFKILLRYRNAQSMKNYTQRLCLVNDVTIIQYRGRFTIRNINILNVSTL